MQGPNFYGFSYTEVRQGQGVRALSRFGALMTPRSKEAIKGLVDGRSLEYSGTSPSKNIPLKISTSSSPFWVGALHPFACKQSDFGS